MVSVSNLAMEEEDRNMRFYETLHNMGFISTGVFVWMSMRISAGCSFK